MTDTTIPEAYKSDHLMLLLGTNPLPNYVAARLLARENTRLHFVVTEEIKQAEIHERLAKLLGRDPKDEQQYLTVKASDPQDIREKVSARILSKEYSGSWGLHYTGGKKVMATHAYRVMETALTEKKQHGVYSYLDADTRELVIETTDGRLERHSAHRKVKVCLEEILELHGRPPSKKAPLRSTPFHEEFGEALVQFIQTAKNLKAWKEFAKTLRHTLKHTPKDLSQAQIPVEIPVIGGQMLGDLTRAWVADINVLPDWMYDKSKGYCRTEVEFLANWLCGKWLEDYVLAAALESMKSGVIDQAVVSIRPEGLVEFEVDVAAMQGYCLFAVAATSGDDEYGLAKLKLFEVMTRARQMGGDEAKVALVTFSEHPEKLEKQVGELLVLSAGVGTTNYRSPVRVFGLTDLPDLDQHLENWFKEV